MIDKSCKILRHKIILKRHIYLKLIEERRERQNLQDILVLLYIVTLSIMPKELERENRVYR